MTEQATRNEAARRLRQRFHWSDAEANNLILEALTTERRNVVEQIEQRFCTCGGGKHRPSWKHCRAHELLAGLRDSIATGTEEEGKS